MKGIRSEKFLFILILLIALGLRLYNLGSYPVNLTPDEAALGYNAYSILDTGRDEYGEFLPVVFKSFGDYKPGLYVYLTVPFVAILGLNEWAVRLPSALAGVGAVWILYKLVNKLFIFKANKGASPLPLLGRGESALLVALALAISPWHIHFSRGAWEANVVLTMVLGGVYLFLSSKLSQRKMALWFSAGMFGLSLWMYQGAKLSTLLVILALILVYGWQVQNSFNRKAVGIWVAILGLLALPIAWGLVSGQTGGRLAVKSIFSYRRSVDAVMNEILLPAGIEHDSWQHGLWHGEWLNTMRMILNRYGNHFSGKFLGFEGDWVHPWLSSPYMGMLYWIDIFMLVIGVSQLFVVRRSDRPHSLLDKEGRNLGSFMLLWLLLAPIPSALTLDEINAVRSLPMVAPLMFFVGQGWWVVLRWWYSPHFSFSQNGKSAHQRIPSFGMGLWGNLRWLRILILAGVVSYQIIYYLDSYYVLAPRLTVSKELGYGYKQIVESLKKHRGGGNKIVVYQSYAQPYIYWLFYEKFSPREYQKVARLKENRYGDVGLVERIDSQVAFREFSLNAEKHLTGNIYIGPPEKVPENVILDTGNFEMVEEIYYPSGLLAYRVVKVLGNNVIDNR